MRDKDTKKDDLLRELAELRRHVAELEETKAKLKGIEEELQERAEKYKALYESDIFYVYIHDLQGKFLDANDAALKKLGYTRHEIESLNFASLLDESQLSWAHKNLQEVLESGSKSAPSIYKLRAKNGDAVWMETDSSLIYREGKPYAIQGVARDITEHKRAEKALLKSEERYRLLADNATDVIWTRDMNLKPTYISPSVTKLRGFSVEEAMAQTTDESMTPDSAELVKKLLGEALTIESREQKDLSRSETVEVEMKCKDDSTVWAEVNMSFLRDRDNKAVGILGISRNISQRKRMEAALRESEEKFRNLAEESPNMIFINTMGRVVYVNRRCEEILGYRKDEFYSSNFDFLSLVTPDYRETLKKAYLKHLDKKEVAPYEYALMTKGGKRIEVTINTKLIHFEGSDAILGIVTDITKLARANEKLLTQKSVLEKKNVAFSEVLEQIEVEKRRIKDDVSTNVRELLLPMLMKLKTASSNTKYIDLIQHHLVELASSFGREITERTPSLTPKEIEISSMVKNGLTSKEIANLLNLSHKTVGKHRRNIRSKLGISNKKINLSSFLQGL